MTIFTFGPLPEYPLAHKYVRSLPGSDSVWQGA